LVSYARARVDEYTEYNRKLTTSKAMGLLALGARNFSPRFSLLGAALDQRLGVAAALASFADASAPLYLDATTAGLL